jgi:tRNA (guanine-N7-)-methyltransferase
MARTRKKKNIPQRMSACSTYWFPVPVANRGHWREVCGMAPDTPLYLELGCGKGDFAVGMAQRYPDICYVALEKDESVILAAIENAAAGGVTNLFFLWTDVALLNNFFAEEEVNRIYINFCDPWSRKDKPKRRLTYRDYLKTYINLLKSDGEIHLKTDDKTLFGFSLKEFADSNLTLRNETTDLHRSEWDADNIRTEFEQKFAGQGITICRVEAHKRA